MPREYLCIWKNRASPRKQKTDKNKIIPRSCLITKIRGNAIRHHFFSLSSRRIPPVDLGWTKAILAPPAP